MLKPVIIGIYGFSNTGKTKLITELIIYFSKLNYKVASIKQSDKPYNIDRVGKDTYKFAEAGSNAISFLTKDQTLFIFKDEMKLNNCIEYILAYKYYDLILVEGVQDKFIQKIRIGNKSLLKNTIFTYDNNLNKIQSFIANKLNERCNYLDDKIELKVNGEKISLSEFPQEFIKNTLIGMVKSLKGIDVNDEIITINISYSK